MPTLPTDADQLTEIASVLIEDASFTSGLWSLAEILGYFNQRQYRFLKETLIVAAWTTVVWVPGQPDATLPDDWIATLVARWHDTALNTYQVLPRSDSFELDHISPQTALTVCTPTAYRDADLGTLLLTLGPPPIAPGEVELLYVALSETLDGSGIPLSTPDEWTPYLKYGVLADMLGKDGRGQDLLRARYCEQRYAEGVALAQAALEGWG